MHVGELGTSGSLPKCGKSRSLEVGECRAQKIQIGEPSAENPGKGVEFCYARRGAWHVGELAKMRQIGELGGRGVPRTKDQDSRAECRKSEQGCRVLLCTSGSLARRGACQNAANQGAWRSGSAAHKRSRLGRQVPKIQARVSSSPTHVGELGIKGTSGSLPKCGKSWSLEVGECSAQKIKIGEPSAENPSKGVEFSFARRGA